MKRTTIEIDEEIEKAAQVIHDRPEYKPLDLSFNKIVRIALAECAATPPEKPATLAQLTEAKDAIITAIGQVKVKSPKGEVEEKPSGYVKKAERAATLEEIGKDRCARMNGTIGADGKTCHYRKHEVLASGRAVDYMTSSTLVALSEEDERNQYSPSKEIWEKAKAEDN